MIKFVTTSLPRSWLARRLTMTDVEQLPKLQARAATAAPADLEVLARNCSAILENFRIGGFFKTTSPNRLSEATRVLLTRGKAARDSIEVLDIGGSDGITTKELVDAMATAWGVQVRATLIDRYVYLEVVRRGALREYRTSDGTPVFLRIGNVAVPLSRTTNPGFAGFVRDRLGYIYGRLSRWRSGMTPEHRISMTNPVVLRTPDIECIEMSCLTQCLAFSGRFAVVRACNIINPRVFTSADRARIYALCHGYLEPNGLFLVSRNQREPAGEVEDGTLWRRTAMGFDVVERFGRGSEVHAEIAEFRIQPQPAAAAGERAFNNS